jgi:methylmalonyl-CoA mutase
MDTFTTNGSLNTFAVILEATKYCSLGQLTAAMFEVGGQYRRNM